MSTLVDEDFTIVVRSTKSSQSIVQIRFWWKLRDWSHRLTSSIVHDWVGGNPESRLKLSDTFHVQLGQSTKPNNPSAQDQCLRIWVGGNPEWIMNRDPVDEIHIPTSSMPRLCFMLAILTLTQIVHLRRGRPVEDSQSGPLEDDRFFCLLAISMCSLVV